MKLFSFLLFLSLLLACYATVLDSAATDATADTTADLAKSKCKSDKDCPHGTRCNKSRKICRYEIRPVPSGLQGRDELGIDISDEGTSDASDLAESDNIKCKGNQDCHDFGKFCMRGICRYLFRPFPSILKARDKSEEANVGADSGSESGADTVDAQGDRCDSDKNCPKGKRCAHGRCRPRLDLLPASPDTVACQKDVDCSKGMCLENICVNAELNDGLDLNDDAQLGISKARKACKENDCPKGKTCLWGVCRFKFRIPHSRRDEGAPEGIIPGLNDDDNNDEVDDGTEMHILTENSEDDPNDADDSEEPLSDVLGRKCKKCSKDKICVNGRCVDRKCGDGPPCKIGRCKNGKCSNGITSRSNDLDTREDANPEDGSDVEKPLVNVLAIPCKPKCNKDQVCSGGRCLYKKCGNSPPCKGGWCRNGKCTTRPPTARSIDESQDEAELAELDYDNLVDNEDSDDAGLETREVHELSKRKKCKTFKDCDAGYACKQKKCTRRKCGEPGACRIGFCKNGKCTRSLGFRSPDLGKRDEFADVNMCKSDDDCAGGACLNGLCFEAPGIFERAGRYPPRCKSEKDCPPKNRCYGGICKWRPHKRDELLVDPEADLAPELLERAENFRIRCRNRNHNECPAQHICYGGVCRWLSGKRDELLEDEDEDDLAPELLERAGKYPPRCKTERDCPPKNRCYGGICKWRPHKRDELLVDPEVEVVEKWHTCTDRRKCRPGYKCIKGVCKYRDKRDAEAIAEPELDLLAAKPPPRCQKSRDCPHHQRCYDGICKSRSPDNGKRDGLPEDDNDLPELDVVDFDGSEDDEDVEE